MAAATTTRSTFFLWPDEFRADYLPDWTFVRDASPRRTYPKFSRSVSIGSPSLTKRDSKPEQRKSKSVHFADSKGLALVSVLTFNAERELQEEFSSFLNLNRNERRTINKGKTAKCQSTLKNSLKLKGRSSEAPTVPSRKLARKVAVQKLCLEKTELLESAIRGTVCVHNLAYEKCIAARYTLDEWRNQNEVHGVFHSNSNVKDMDRFVFEIPIPNESPPKNYKVEFAVCYTVLGDTFWDNNNGFNYHVLFARAG